MEQIHWGVDSYVMHKYVHPSFKGRMSIWYDGKGTVTAAEQILPNNRVRPVKPNGPMWKLAQSAFWKLVRRR